MNVEQARQALGATPASPGNLTAATFEDEGERSPATSDGRERVARVKAKAPMWVRGNQRFELSIPAYQQFQTNGTADETETFELNHSIVDTPNTQNLVVWKGGEYQGAEGATDGIDYDANTFQFTDSGTNNPLHVWYISDASCDFEIEKVTSSENSKQSLYSENLRLVHQTNLSEQPEDPDVGSTPLNPAVATDMWVEVYVDAPYQFRWTDPNGHGATATNLLFSFPINRATEGVEGLESAVATDMSRE